MPSSALFMVLTSPKPGREEEFDDWYERHQAEVVTMAGWATARRFRLRHVEAGAVRHQSLAIYGIHDLELAQASLTRARVEREVMGNTPGAFLHSSDSKQEDVQISWWTPVNASRVAG